MEHNSTKEDSRLSSYYGIKGSYSEVEIFEKNYKSALELMGGDKLLKPSNALNGVAIRKTSTHGLYKVIESKLDLTFNVQIIDEVELLNNRKYSKGTISQISDDEYEITYFDDEDEIEIYHYSKENVIAFMKDKKLVFQA